MFPAGNPYRKLHRRRRRNPRALVIIALALLLVGCAAAAAMWVEPRGIDQGSKNDVVAMLTAQDAVRSATAISVPRREWIADLPAVPEVEPESDRWGEGRSGQYSGKLRKDQSISVALATTGVSQTAIGQIVAAVQGELDFRRSRPGDAWEIEVRPDGRISRFRYQASPVDIVETRWEDDRYATQKIDVAVETRVDVVSGTIDQSLWQAFEQTGAGGQLAVAYAEIFAYTIDFVTETQPGDRFAVAYESTWLDGQRLKTGKIIGAQYKGAAGDHFAFYWEKSDGEGAYYDEAGESVERQFLRSPLRTTRITSRYGRRFHPVLGRMKMHAGVDYGAPIGTPVQAVANATVTYAGWKGANGKLITLRHAGGYTTYHAHLSQIAPGIRPGVRVKKKQIIGKVGNTGRSTGPHLHFGMKRHGKYINPLEVDFERGAPLQGAAKTRYLAEVSELREQLNRSRE